MREVTSIFTLPIIISIFLLLTSCITGQVKQDLDTLIESKGYIPINPPRSDYSPGTLINSDIVLASSNDVFPGQIPSNEPAVAAWLRHWNKTQNITSDLSLLGLLAPDYLTKLDKIKSGLSSNNVSTIQVIFGDATIDVITPSKIQSNWEEIPDHVKDYLIDGNQMILEAIKVNDLSVNFYDENGKSVNLSASRLSNILDTKFSFKLTSTEDGSIAVDEPVYLGIRKASFDIQIGTGGSLKSFNIKKEFSTHGNEGDRWYHKKTEIRLEENTSWTSECTGLNIAVRDIDMYSSGNESKITINGKNLNYINYEVGDQETIDFADIKLLITIVEIDEEYKLFKWDRKTPYVKLSIVPRY